ncbi:MAG: hypothetical protein R3Y49_07550 [Rikenellaceae bacterium]
MRRRMRVAFASIFALVAVSCNTSSYYEFSENFFFFPYVILSDTTYVKADSVDINMNSELVEYFVEEGTAYIDSYSGSGEYYSEAYQQIYDVLEAEYEINLAKVEKYDYESLLADFAENFSGKVEVVYEVRESSTQMWAFRDTVATFQLVKVE